MLMGFILLLESHIKWALAILKFKSYSQSYSLLKMYPPNFAILIA